MTDDSPMALVVDRLMCPQCQAAVRIEPDALVCPEGHRMSIVNGFIDASEEPTDEETARTFRSFGYEWTTFDAIQPEDEGFWRNNYFRDVALDELQGRVGLDAGCGKGRFTKFTAPYLKALVALDGSSAVEAAVRNMADVPNVVVMKGDLRSAPLRPRSFDFISSLGVLHHLPDPRAGFRRLVDLLAPEGLLLLYLYSRPEGRGVRATGLKGAEVLRRVTRGIPHPILRAISGPLAAVLYGTLVIPGQLGDSRKSPRLSALPLSTYRNQPLRTLWLDTFDRLSAPIENRYTWGELEGWLVDAGLTVEAARESAGWFIVARKTERASPTAGVEEGPPAGRVPEDPG